MTFDDYIMDQFYKLPTTLDVYASEHTYQMSGIHRGEYQRYVGTRGEPGRDVERPMRGGVEDVLDGIRSNVRRRSEMA